MNQGKNFFDFAFVAAPTLVRAKPFHLLSQIACLLERPTGAFIAAQPQGRSKRIFTKGAVMGSCIEILQCRCRFFVTTLLIMAKRTQSRFRA